MLVLLSTGEYSEHVLKCSQWASIQPWVLGTCVLGMYVCKRCTRALVQLNDSAHVGVEGLASRSVWYMLACAGQEFRHVRVPRLGASDGYFRESNKGIVFDEDICTRGKGA